jgi:hypothetical protein
LMVTEGGSGALVGVVIKKVSGLFFPIGNACVSKRANSYLQRLVAYLDGMEEE